MKILFFFVVLCQATVAQARSTTLEAYGDSLTAGFLSDERNLTNPPPLKEISTTLSDLAMYIFTGESSFKEPYEYRNNAWPAKLADKIQTHYGYSVEARNYGVVGALTRDLPKQLAELPFGTTRRAMAFVFIGHNDLDDLSVANADALAEKHRKDLSEFFAAWDRKHYESTMHVIPVGHVYKVYQNLKGYTWFKNPPVTYRCEDSWQKFFPYAGFYYKKMQEGKLEEFLVPRVQGLQREQREAAREWNATSQRNNYYYNEPKIPFAYIPENFAIDCFHLSGKGEQFIADTIFETLNNAPFY